MRQENRSSPQCVALSPNRCYAVPKDQKNTKMWNREPLATKIRKYAKSNRRKIKCCRRISREILTGRAKKDPGSREGIQSRAKMFSVSRETQTVSREIIRRSREERRFWRRSRAQKNLLAWPAENLRAKIPKLARN